MSTPVVLTQSLSPAHLSPVTAYIRLSAIAHNLQVIQALLPQQCAILPIVKADGYGHGAVAVAQLLFECGIRQFGVSTVEEGVELRGEWPQSRHHCHGGLVARPTA